MPELTQENYSVLNPHGLFADANSLDKSIDSAEVNYQLSLEKLKTNAQQQLKKITAQTKNIEQFKSNMDIIKQRYQLEESYFGRFALFYGNLNGWIRWGLSITVATLGTTLGIFFSAPLLVGAITLTIYSAITFFLWDHFLVSKQREERLCQDIVNLERSLAESVTHLSLIEDNLKQVLASLCKLNVRQAGAIELLEKQIKVLKQRLDVLAKISTKLEISHSSIDTSATVMQHALEHTERLLDNLDHEMDDLGTVKIKIVEMPLPSVELDALNLITQGFSEQRQNLVSLLTNFSTFIEEAKTKKPQQDLMCLSSEDEENDVENQINRARAAITRATDVIHQHYQQEKHCEASPVVPTGIEALLMRAKQLTAMHETGVYSLAFQ